MIATRSCRPARRIRPSGAPWTRKMKQWSCCFNLLEVWESDIFPKLHHAYQINVYCTKANLNQSLIYSSSARPSPTNLMFIIKVDDVTLANDLGAETAAGAACVRRFAAIWWRPALLCFFSSLFRIIATRARRIWPVRSLVMDEGTEWAGVVL